MAGRHARHQQRERQEQRVLAQYLDLLGVLWCHVPNGGERNPMVGRNLKLEGVKRGVPDVMIYTKPPLVPGSLGCAIELKAEGGEVSDAQAWWLERLSAAGWCTAVCYGADEAIGFLRELGYVRAA